MRAFSAVSERVSTHKRCEIVDITHLVAGAVDTSGINSGIAVVCVPHTTAGITINENADPDVKHDLLRKLEQLVPQHEAFYQHNEGNSDGHVKTALVGNSATIIVEDGKLMLGTWQGVYFCEFDGPRQRTVVIKVIGQP